MNDLLTLQSNIDQAIGRRDQLVTQLKKHTKERNSLKKSISDHEEARMIVQKVSKLIQSTIENYVSEMVTLALGAVFPEEDIKFELEFEERRGNVEGDLWFVEEGNRARPRESSQSGGAIDVASIALRIALWSLTKQTRNTLILDEPFRNLKDETKQLQMRAREMIKSLSSHPDINLQIIMISHDPTIQEGADRLFKVTKENKVSKVEVIL